MSLAPFSKWRSSRMATSEDTAADRALRAGPIREQWLLGQLAGSQDTETIWRAETVAFQPRQP
jgi:hypothetical protein